MRNIITIMRRELSSYFLSPIIYIVTAIFVFIYSFFFSLLFLGRGNGGYANIQYTFGELVIVFMFIIPFMTMRSLSEERKSGTEEFLMTAPITSTEIVLGKLLSLTVSFSILLSTLLVYLGIVLCFAQPELGPIISGFIGLFLLGFTFISIGLFASSLTDNQIIAGVVGFTFLLVLWLINMLADSFVGILGLIFSYLSFIKYFGDFTNGILDTTNIIFFLSVAGLFTFLAIRQVEGRRWR